MIVFSYQSIIYFRLYTFRGGATIVCWRFICVVLRNTESKINQIGFNFNLFNFFCDKNVQSASTHHFEIIRNPTRISSLQSIDLRHNKVITSSWREWPRLSYTEILFLGVLRRQRRVSLADSYGWPWLIVDCRTYKSLM